MTKIIKYRLTCKKCDLDQIHTTDNFDTLTAFWHNWNLKNSELMKCKHEFVFEKLG